MPQLVQKGMCAFSLIGRLVWDARRVNGTSVQIVKLVTRTSIGTELRSLIRRLLDWTGIHSAGRTIR